MMLGLSPKRSTAADLASALARAHAPDAAGRHAAAFAAVQGLRARALAPSGDEASDGDRATLRLYRAQLASVETRLPQAAVDAAKLVFAWTDTLKPAAIVPHASLAYESACLLFNEAALMSTAAAKAYATKTPDGRKAAVKGFREAAGAFAFLKDAVMPRHVGAVPFDLSVDAGLPFFIALMQAQAQFVIYKDQMEKRALPADLAKLAAAAADFYRAAWRALQPRSGADAATTRAFADVDAVWPFAAHCAVHAALLDGASFKQTAEHHGLHARGDAARGIAATAHGYGAEIAYWSAAKAAAEQAIKLAAAARRDASGRPLISAQIAEDLADEADRKVAALLPDNNAIYNELIPDYRDIGDQVPKLALATVTPWKEPTLADLGAPDELEAVVPAALQAALLHIDDALEAQAAETRDRAAAASALARATLAELGLPGLIEPPSPGGSGGGGGSPGGERLPDAVWARVAAAAAAGGAAELERLAAANRAAADGVAAALERAQRSLNDEALADAHMRGAYGAGWTLAPSSAAFAKERRLCDVYAQQSREARAVDAATADKLRAAGGALAALRASRAELSARVPPAPTGAALSPLAPDLGSVRDELRHYCAELKALVDARPQLAAGVKARFNRPAVIGALTRASSEARAAVVEAAVAGTLPTEGAPPGGTNPGRAAFEANLAAQPPLLDRIRAAAAHFVELRGADPAMREHERGVAGVAALVDAHDELRSQLRAGADFWAELAAEVGKLAQNTADAMQARSLYGRDLAAALQRAAAAASPRVPPPAPGPATGAPFIDARQPGFDVPAPPAPTGSFFAPPPAYAAPPSAVGYAMPPPPSAAGYAMPPPPPPIHAPLAGDHYPSPPQATAPPTERTHAENVARIAAAARSTAAAASPAADAALPFFAQEQQLVDCGFSRAAARKALADHRGDLESAMNQLLNP